MYRDYLKGTADILEASAVEREQYTVNIEGHSFVVHLDVFSPKYFFDTAFFARELSIKSGEDMLEIGAGTGVTAVLAALRGAGSVTAIDINTLAVVNTKENVQRHNVADVVTVLEGDIYEPIPEGRKFDTIYWNVPFGYVRGEKDLSMLERAVFDPEYQAIKRFIAEAKDYLKSDGRVMIGFSTTLGRFDIVEDCLRQHGFTVRCIAQTESMETHPVSFELFEAKRAKG